MNALLALVAAVSLIVEVFNPSYEYREQVVEIPLESVLESLGTTADSLRVREAAGLDVPHQVTYDGKLLIEAAVRKGGVARFTIEKGRPQVFPMVCHGALHPERKDDFAWENDRGAYRVYGPALERTGERSFGVDVWTKNTPELVVDERFRIEDVVMMPKVDSLRRIDRHRGDSLYRTISYHHDHGRGFDPYRVGPTLGCGAPALMLGDSIVMPYCFERYEILDEGPLRFSVRLTQSPRLVNGSKVVEHRVITLDKGSNFNRMTVSYEGLAQQVGFCSGVVIQREDPEPVVLGENYVSYTDPTDQLDVDQAPLYVAVLFTEGPVVTRRLHGHALGIVPRYQGEPYTYYFGSAWAKYDVRTPEEWKARIEWTLRALGEPLRISLKMIK